MLVCDGNLNKVILVFHKTERDNINWYEKIKSHIIR